MNHFLFGKILHRKVITEVDHFETGSVQTVFVKEMDPGAVSLVIAGDALEFKRAAGTGSKDHAGQPMFSHGCRDPVGTARMAGGKTISAWATSGPFLGQFQNLSQYPLRGHRALQVQRNTPNRTSSAIWPSASVLVPLWSGAFGQGDGLTGTGASRIH